jgi:hypothetical protein
MKPGDFTRRTQNPLSSPWNLMRSISPEIPSVAGLRSAGAAFMGRSRFAMGSGSQGCRQDAILADGLSNRAEIRHDELTMGIDDRWANAHEVPSGVEFAGRLDIGGELPSSRNETSAAMCLRNIMAYASEPAMQPSLDPCASSKHRAVRSAAGLSRTESRQRRRLPTEE